MPLEHWTCLYARTMRPPPSESIDEELLYVSWCACVRKYVKGQVKPGEGVVVVSSTHCNLRGRRVSFVATQHRCVWLGMEDGPHEHSKNLSIFFSPLPLRFYSNVYCLLCWWSLLPLLSHICTSQFCFTSSSPLPFPLSFFILISLYFIPNEPPASSRRSTIACIGTNERHHPLPL